MQKFVLILFVGVLGILVANQMEKTSVVTNDVVLENVEALAGGETVGITLCFGSGNYICPDNNERVKTVYIGYSLR